MNFAIWIGIEALCLINLLWYAMVRRDAVHYAQTKLKLLGEDQHHEVITPFLRRSVRSYGFVLTMMMVAFNVYLAWIYA